MTKKSLKPPFQKRRISAFKRLRDSLNALLLTQGEDKKAFQEEHGAKIIRMKTEMVNIEKRTGKIEELS
jgi:hypothetical protein